MKHGKISLICLSLLFIAVCSILMVSPAKADVPWPGTLYFRQSGQASCTLASTVMMMRARTFLSMNNTWSTITELGTESVAWIDNVGLKSSFTYTWSGNSISVASIAATGGVRADEIIGLLDDHPEGIVLYCGGTGIKHAVFITDYVDGTFYCADPSETHYSVGRRTLGSSLLGDRCGGQAGVLSNVTRVWYVSSYSIQETAAPVDVKSGVYVIHSARKDSLVLNIENDSTAIDANIELLTENHSDVQKFRIFKRDDNWYYVKSVYSGKWLDIKSPFENNANVKLYHQAGAFENYWRFEDAGDGYVYIRSRRGVYLDIAQDMEVDHANVQVYEFTGGKSEKWRLEDVTDYAAVDDGVYRIQSVLDSQYYFDIENDSSSVNANILLRQFRDSDTQQFRFINHGSYYTVQSVYNNLWLDVKSPFTDNSNVKLFNSCNDPEDHWLLEEAGDGTYFIRNNRGFYLNISENNATENANIETLHFVGNNVQKWLLVKVSHTVSYDANGGENAPEAQIKNLNTSLTLAATIPTREGYNFLHWNTAPDDNGTSYDPGAAFDVDEDTVLYAIWGGGEITEITGPESMTILMGDKARLELSTKPAGADLSKLSFEFSTPACATIDDEQNIHAWYVPGASSTVLTITAPNGVFTTVPINILSNIQDNWEAYINNQPRNETETIDVYKVGQTVPYRVKYEVSNKYDPGYDLTINDEYSYPLTLNKDNKTITFTSATTLVPGLDNSMEFGLAGSYFDYGTILITDDQMSAYLPEDLQFIETEAFKGSAARYFFLPDDVFEIGDNAFPEGSTVFLNTRCLFDYGFQSDGVVFVESGDSYNELFATAHDYYVRRETQLPEVLSE